MPMTLSTSNNYQLTTRLERLSNYKETSIQQKLNKLNHGLRINEGNFNNSNLRKKQIETEESKLLDEFIQELNNEYVSSDSLIDFIKQFFDKKTAEKKHNTEQTIKKSGSDENKFNIAVLSIDSTPRNTAFNLDPLTYMISSIDMKSGQYSDDIAKTDAYSPGKCVLVFAN